MENKIKVGEYVRTNEGIIDKVDRYSIGSCVYHCKNGMCIDECETVGIHISDIKKHSFNIIDLIEEGDYVNGIYVEKNNGRYLETLECCYQDSSLGHIEYIKIFPSEIHSIVTKEQFKSAEYEV